MIFFRNDYGEGCIEPIMKLLQQANDESNPGYGEDKYSQRARELIQSKLPDVPSDIHFIVSGTLTNVVMMRHVLRPYQCVLCTDSSHIVQHEAGAIEQTGHKIIQIPNSSGKISAVSLSKTINKLKGPSEDPLNPTWEGEEGNQKGQRREGPGRESGWG